MLGAHGRHVPFLASRLPPELLLQRLHHEVLHCDLAGHAVQLEPAVKLLRDAGRQLRPGFVGLRHLCHLALSTGSKRRALWQERRKLRTHCERRDLLVSPTERAFVGRARTFSACRRGGSRVAIAPWVPSTAGPLGAEKKTPTLGIWGCPRGRAKEQRAKSPHDHFSGLHG